MTIPRQVLLDDIKSEILTCIVKYQQDKGLTPYDIESVLYQVLTEVKTDKEVQYSNLILTMAEQITSLENKVNELSKPANTKE